MQDECVFIDEDFAIVRTTTLFYTGFNVYKSTEPEGCEFIKINDRLSFFTSLDKAKEWLTNYKIKEPN